MRFSEKLVKGRLIGRLNRFAALVELEGRREVALLPNSGRLHELMVRGLTFPLTPRP